jgi:hypothetical protein
VTATLVSFHGPGTEAVGTPEIGNMKFLNIGLQATNMHVEVWNMHVCVTMHCNATTAVHALDL